MSETEPQESTMKAVYTVIDRGRGKKSLWLRLGTAWVNRDGSLNLKLDALPVNGSLHVRDLPDREEEVPPPAPPTPPARSDRPARTPGP